MDHKRVLELLTKLEAEGKVVGILVPTLYDPNGNIAVTFQTGDAANGAQFLADVAGTEDEPAAPKAAKKLGGKKGK